MGTMRARLVRKPERTALNIDFKRYFLAVAVIFIALVAMLFIVIFSCAKLVCFPARSPFAPTGERWELSFDGEVKVKA